MLLLAHGEPSTFFATRRHAEQAIEMTRRLAREEGFGRDRADYVIRPLFATK
jgi:hypothetical protein